MDKIKITRLINDYKSKSYELHHLIILSVDGSTLRSYSGNKKYTPSSVFRKWAFEFLTDSKILIEEQRDYSHLHQIAYSQLQQFWLHNDGTPLDLYKALKLVDLLFKHIPQWKDLRDERREWLFENVFVPLDKYSLRLLREISEKYKKLIPHSASMGFMQNKNIDFYYEIQSEIKQIMRSDEAIVNAPLVFDLYAWNGKETDNVSFDLVPIK